MNGPTRLAAGTEAEVRRIIREEVRAVFAEVEDVARTMYLGEEDETRETAFTAITQVANAVLTRMTCEHRYTSEFGSLVVCRTCGREWGKPDR